MKNSTEKLISRFEFNGNFLNFIQSGLTRLSVSLTFILGTHLISMFKDCNCSLCIAPQSDEKTL